jgi:hypothetical protein
MGMINKLTGDKKEPVQAGNYGTEHGLYSTDEKFIKTKIG